MENENNQEAVERVLTQEEVEEIRLLARTPGNSYQSVADKYRLDVGHVRYITRRESK